jgi:hypothetical protein
MSDEKSSDSASVPPLPAEVGAESRLLKGKELAVVFTGLLLGILLIALDQTIVGA